MRTFTQACLLVGLCAAVVFLPGCGGGGDEHDRTTQPTCGSPACIASVLAAQAPPAPASSPDGTIFPPAYCSSLLPRPPSCI